MITFKFDIETTEKTHSIINNVDRVLVKKKVLMLASNKTDTINNSDIYHTYINLYLSEKECEEKLLQCIQSANRFKGTCGCKKDRWYSTDNGNPGKCG